MPSILVWVEQPAPREEGHRKSEGNGTGALLESWITLEDREYFSLLKFKFEFEL